MPTEKRPLKVFLCHASGDKPVVHQLYKYLCNDGVDAWLDSEKLIPGQKWQLEIPKAVRSSDVVIVCLSERSTNKEGYISKEIEFALDIADKQPEGTIFVIPARLEECRVPERLNNYQWVNLFESQGYNRLIVALGIRAKQINAKTPGRTGIFSLWHPARQVTVDDLVKETKSNELSHTEKEESVVKPSGSKRKSSARIFIEMIGLVASVFGIITFLTGVENIRNYFQPIVTFSETENSLPVLNTETPNPSKTPLQTSVPSVTPTASVMPTSTSLATEITDDLGVEMMLVPAGEFTMGKNANDAFAEVEAECRGHEEYSSCQLEWYEPSSPEHQVYLDAFYMDTYEVTNTLYKDCVDAGICDLPEQTSSNSHSSYYGNPQFDNYPVIFVNWNMVNTYCKIWRGGYLPSEAQWEKAARGGLDGKNYPWGDEFPICVKGAENGARIQNTTVINGCIEKDTELVGSYSPNGYGLYDMVGNVAEWVDTWYDAYPGSSFSSPHYGTTQRVVRDGGWNNDLGVWKRTAYPLSSYYKSLGFRCAKDAAP